MNIRAALDYRKQSNMESVPINIDGIDEVAVRRITAGEMLDIAKMSDQEGGMALVAASIVDDHGEKVFASADDVRGVDWVLLQALIQAATQVNGIQAKIDVAAKN